VDGIEQLGYGKKEKDEVLMHIIRSECKGQSQDFLSGICAGAEVDWFLVTRVFSSIYTNDAKYVLSGSDDGNVRIWKARASDRLGVVDARERAAREYRDKLRERWAMDAEVGRIER
jgi:WD40 repeat protein